MQIDLTGKTALVTASTGGIGFAIARGLLESGATVVINGRSDASVARAGETLMQAFPKATLQGVAADLGDAAGVDTLLGQLPAQVDILVNNAGIFQPGDFFDTNDNTWEAHWQTNVMSGVRLSRVLVPAMVSRGWGRVVFVSSESARNIPLEMIHYGVSKTAQLGVSRGLAKRVAGTGVTVNCVLPGPTLSDGFADMLKDEAARSGKTLQELGSDFVKQHRPGSLIQRAASVDEIANMVVYVCSQQAAATTGSALRVDGGLIDDIS